MVLQLHNTDSNFDEAFQTLLAQKREQSEDVLSVVNDIIRDVQTRGDEALRDFTLKFDHVDLNETGFQIAEDDIAQAHETVDDKTYDALELAAERIRYHHEKQLPEDSTYVDKLGVNIGTKWTAIDAVGLYVPGGTANYPSSVLMNAIPAKVAGCKRVAMVVPTPYDNLNPLVLVAAHLAGVDEIYRIGGAQAIAALAYGTALIAPVAKIVGPGNAYVAAAKRQVFGKVGIDMVAGPSEVLVVADAYNNPEWIAADLLAQAEHDKAAQSILITNDIDFANAVSQSVDAQLKILPRAEIARHSWETYGAILILDDLDHATPLIDQIAPEHLELAIDNAETMLDKINNAGSVFLGCHTPEAFGDYVAGTNHVLPTARSARFSSGLGVFDFMKRTSVLRMSETGIETLGPAAMALAKSEGLEAHSRSVEMRLKKT
ncbi:MAG: histidinol dehydrogenase [Pseudomonadota bacterium]